MVKATSEVGKKAINPNCVYPVIVFHIRVFTEVEMQVLIFIAECVGVHLQVNSQRGLVLIIKGQTYKNKIPV